jgi:hypothetical protein
LAAQKSKATARPENSDKEVLMRVKHATAGAIVLAFLMSVSGAAFAEGNASGSTSGPAAGKNVVPNAAVQKSESNGTEAGGEAGGPGVAGQPGSKDGPAQTPKNNGSGNQQ